MRARFGTGLVVGIFMMALLAMSFGGGGGMISLSHAPERDTIRGAKFVTVAPEEPADNRSGFRRFLETVGVVSPPPPPEPAARERVVVRRNGTISPRMATPSGF